MRKQYGTTNAVLSAELDRVFTNIVFSNLTAAALQLTGMESNVPVIYNASATSGQLQFSIGGFIFGAKMNVQASRSLVAGGWQTVATLPVGTNLMLYSASIPTNGTAMFFKLQ